LANTYCLGGASGRDTCRSSRLSRGCRITTTTLDNSPITYGAASKRRKASCSSVAIAVSPGQKCMLAGAYPHSLRARRVGVSSTYSRQHIVRSGWPDGIWSLNNCEESCSLGLGKAPSSRAWARRWAAGPLRGDCVGARQCAYCKEGQKAPEPSEVSLTAAAGVDRLSGAAD